MASCRGPRPAGPKFPPGNKAFVASLTPVSNVNRKRMQVFYSGRVQGVGFRYTVKSVASGFDLTGTVRNLIDGRVELLCEGVQDELDAFREAIRQSGLEHFIQKEAVTWAESKNEFRGFQIVS